MAAPHSPHPYKSEKPWREALMRAVKRKNAGDVLALERLADAAVDRGLAGDISAIKEIGDRLDGRPHQGISADIQGALTVKWAEK